MFNRLFLILNRITFDLEKYLDPFQVHLLLIPVGLFIHEGVLPSHRFLFTIIYLLFMDDLTFHPFLYLLEREKENDFISYKSVCPIFGDRIPELVSYRAIQMKITIRSGQCQLGYLIIECMMLLSGLLPLFSMIESRRALVIAYEQPSSTVTVLL